MFLVITSGLNFVSAENEVNNTLASISTTEEEEKLSRNEADADEIVSANEDGHFNISFDDGYSGYCINYMSEEASKGDNFTVTDTSYAINNESKNSIGNELKTFFVDYYDTAMENKIKTQHIIWHFSNNFTGWRFSQDLIEDIRHTSSQKIIPDHGAVRKINNTTEAVFDFEVLLSHTEGYQNYFAYKITFRDILEAIEPDFPLKNESMYPNETLKEDNMTTPKNEAVKKDIENITHSQEDKIKNKDKILEKEYPENLNSTSINQIEDKKELENKINLKRHQTGYNYIPSFIILIFGTLLIIKYLRD